MGWLMLVVLIPMKYPIISPLDIVLMDPPYTITVYNSVKSSFLG